MVEIYVLALVVCLAVGLGMLAQKLKLPLLVSYIAAGALLSAVHLIAPGQLKFLSILPEIGLAFLLFLVGMELDLREFKSLGKNVLLATFGQVVITTVLVGAIGLVLGLPMVSAVLIGLAVSFSSTILVVKLLLEGKELASIYGKLSIGILLTEDLLAVVVLMLVSVFRGSGDLSTVSLVLVAVKGAVLIGLSVLLGRSILPKILEFCAESSELLFLGAIGWCLLFVSMSGVLGFSLAIGAFLAGVSLAQSVFRIQISSRIKPLRDFFIMIFFLDLGTGISFTGLGTTWPIVVAVVLYVAVLKPIIFFLLFTASRFRAHSAFQTGIMLSSVSEFSLILLTTASVQGLLPASLASPFILATVISFVSSSLLITHGKAIYLKSKNVLKTFEEKNPISFDSPSLGEREFDGHAILIGCHRSGEIILEGLKKLFDDNLIVLDFNPDVIKNLQAKGITCIYGDVADVEVMDRLKLERAKVVVSTVRDMADNLALLDVLAKLKSKAAVIVTAEDGAQALRLYENGAHHVSLPMSLEGANISHLVKEYREDFHKLTLEKEKRIEELKNGKIYRS